MALAIAICVFGLTLIIGSLVMFAFGNRENQSSPPSTAAETVFTVGLLLAFLIAASYWIPIMGGFLS